MESKKFGSFPIIGMPSQPSQNTEQEPTPAPANLREVARNLFEQLSSIYSSPHFPNQEERLQAILALEKALNEGVNPDLMLLKMKQLADKTEFKTKVSNTIINKYWEMTIVQGVVAKVFDINKEL